MGAKPKLSDFYFHPATPRTLDFRNAKEVKYFRNGNRRIERVLIDDRPTSNAGESMGKGSADQGLLMTDVQMKRRAIRRAKKGIKLTEEAFDQLYKPIEEWDNEELARGRPRNAAGTFTGPKPKYVSREIHERAMERFKLMVRQGMNVGALSALGVVDTVLSSDEVDHRGKPIVPASTKLDAAKYLLDHVVGKPTQPVQTDISVKLQAILGDVMVNPTEIDPAQTGYAMAHYGQRAITSTPQIDQGIIDVDPVDDDDD